MIFENTRDTVATTLTATGTLYNDWGLVNATIRSHCYKELTTEQM